MTANHESYKFITNYTGFRDGSWWEFLSNSPFEGKQNRQLKHLNCYMVNKNQFVVFVADQEFSHMQNIMCFTYASDKAGNCENAISTYKLL
jgi:hypothetical protein